MKSRTILLTGFEPYGGRGINPSYEVARHFDGTRIGAHPVAGVTLPVSFNGLRERIEKLLNTHQPAAALSLGLWPGEAVIRLERVALNMNDFEIPDNENLFIRNQAIVPGHPAALFSTLPLESIVGELLADGLPARISQTAGAFLCNATMFNTLSLLKDRDQSIPCGFLHLPYLPRQVAQLLVDVKAARSMELHQRADLASMDRTTMIRAVEICLKTTASSLQSSGKPYG